MICKLLERALDTARGMRWGWWMLIGMALAVLLAAWALSAMTGGTTARTEAKLNRNVAEAAMASGQDAVATIGAQTAAEQAADALTKENDDAIRNAEGAGAPVPPAVAAAGRFSLCKRAAYRGSAECMQFTPATGMEAGSAGGTAPR